jgi:uncharacterized coiled-coil protein SlyX
MALDFNSILQESNKLKGIIAGLHNKKNTFDAQVKEKIEKLKNEIKELGDKLDTLSEDKWNNIKKEEKDVIVKKIKDELPAEVNIVENALSGIDIAGKEACWVTSLGVAFLLLLIGIYLGGHFGLKDRLYDRVSEEKFFKIIGLVDGEITKKEVDLRVVNEAVQKLSNDKGDLLVSEFDDRINSLKGLTAAASSESQTTAQINKLTGKMKDTDEGAQDRKTDKPGKPLLVDQSDSNVKKIKEEIEKVDKEARALSGNAGFFWIGGHWKWCEIVFWGEFGVIIGIITWVSSKMESGEYTKQKHRSEIYWYLVEVAIGPVVVIAVFFLLKQFIGTILSGITITEEDVRGSIFLTLGISFSLGLFIRRSLGIFDFIKDKLPLPKS